MNRRELIQAGWGALSVATATRGFAQGKPVRIVVGFPAGGSTDVVARLIAHAARSHFDGPIVVENRVGAGGRLAIENVKAGDTDGSALLLTPNPMITMYPSTFKRLSYVPLKDLQAVARVVTFPMLVAVGPMVPTSVATFPDLVKWLKANPDKATFAHTGDGSGPHFYGLLLSKEIGVSLLPVGYRGDTPAVQDTMGGQVALTINTPAAQLPLLPTGRLRVLATTGAKRIEQLPGVPTLSELGYSLQTSDWLGAFLAAGAPAAVVTKWQNALREALANRDVQNGLQKLELEGAFVAATDFSRMVREETNQWSAIVKNFGYVAQD